MKSPEQTDRKQVLMILVIPIYNKNEKFASSEIVLIKIRTLQAMNFQLKITLQVLKCT
jgi:hypothetical protein